MTGNTVIGKVVNKYADISTIYIYTGQVLIPMDDDEYWVKVSVNEKIKSYDDFFWYKSCKVGDDFKFAETYNNLTDITKLKPLGCT